MTSILDLLPPEHVFGGLRAATKAEALAQLARRAAGALGLPEAAVLQPLLRREALGSTAIGRGVAIPHAVLPMLDRSFALFALAAAPIPFDAVDRQPVQAIFLLLTPEACAAESTHLLALACRGLRDPAVLAGLGQAPDDGALHAALTRLFRPRRAA
jgi:PTS system nitrogen regulatory IIA component